MASGIIPRDINSIDVSSTLYDLSNVTTEPVDIILSVNRSSFNWFVFALTTASTNPSGSRGILVVPNAGLTAGAYYYVAVGNAQGTIRVSSVSGEPMKIRIISTSFTSLYCYAVTGIV